MVAPGGGNIMLMYGSEGLEIAERYNEWGVTAFVLTYRLSPRYDDDARVLDGKRAIQLVRSRASEFQLDPAKVGFIGFSAGSSLGHLVAAASGPGDPDAADPVDRYSSRPDYLGLVYGPGRVAPGEIAQELPADVPSERPGGYRHRRWLRAALCRADTRRCHRRDSRLSERPARLRERFCHSHLFRLDGPPPALSAAGWIHPWRQLSRAQTLHCAGAALALVPFAGRWRTAPDTPPKIVNDGHGDYVYVPAGSFHMGDNFGDGEARERPAHIVDLDAFYIGKFEMTNKEWKAFRDDPGYDDPKFWPGGRVVPKDQNSYWTNASQHGGGTPDSDGYPLQGVNWDAATAYCNWLSTKTGKKYRLPTEAEWEKAARGTDQRRYPWGNTIDHSFANFTGGFNFGRFPASTTAASAATSRPTATPRPMAPSTWRAT